jgi:hypothetical protein
MNELNTDTLKKLLSLTKKKDKLVAQISQIDQMLSAFSAGSDIDLTALQAVMSVKTPKVAKGSRRKRSPKGYIDQEINRMLQTASIAGVSVSEISRILNKSNIQISGWFSKNAKEGLVERISKGFYRLATKTPITPSHEVAEDQGSPAEGHQHPAH